MPLNLCLQGAMTFGEEGQEGARVYDVKEIEAILDIFQAHGHDEVSNMYI
jgi:aflatoxin B1 aldehyde reductase